MLLRLQATEKISTVASTIITVVVVALIAVFLLIFISITAGYWLADVTGSLTAGFGIVALFYLVVFLFVAFFLRKILQNFFLWQTEVKSAQHNSWRSLDLLPSSNLLL